MTDSMPAVGEQVIHSHQTVVRVCPQKDSPKEILTVPEYWSTAAGHIFFLNGHGFEVQDVSTFFHFDAHGHNSMVAVVDARPRPEL